MYYEKNHHWLRIATQVFNIHNVKETLYVEIQIKQSD